MTRRTDQQRKAIEVFCRELAAELNAKGYDQKITLSKLRNVKEIPWTQASAKELWRAIQREVAHVESTTELDTTAPSDVHTALMWMLHEAGVEIDYIEFPSLR